VFSLSFCLLSLCSSHGLIVSGSPGSWFRRLNVHRWTWASNDGRTKKEIDHIITKDIRSIKSYCVFRGAEALANTDHFLTAAKYAVQPQFKHHLKCTRQFDSGKLRHDLTTASTYATALSNRFEALADLPDDVESAWSSVCDSFQLAAEETLGFVKPHRRPWLTLDTLEILEKKSAARRANDTAERKRLQGIFQAKAKADREAYFNRLADEAEEGMHHNDLKPAYAAIRRLREDADTQKNAPVMRKDGQPCSSQQEVLQRWCEHYFEALNHPTAPACQELDDTQANAMDDTTIATDAPTLSESSLLLKSSSWAELQDRQALWKALRGIGMPQVLLKLIEDLHTGTTSRVHLGGLMSDSFSTSFGVRQGCILAPALFCRATDWIMERTA